LPLFLVAKALAKESWRQDLGGIMQAIDNVEGLTDKQKGIVSLVAQGLNNEQIARRLFISEGSVRHNLSSVFRKLGVSNRFDLIILAFVARLV
jgi:DNA-binding NarL/FixJ family response regulator